MFPTSINGRVELALLDAEQLESVLSRIERELEAAKAVDIQRDANRIAFRGGLFRFRLVSNWNILAAVGSGTIEVVPGRPAVLEFRFSTVEMLVTVTGLLVLMSVLVGIDELPGTPLRFFFFGWLWLFGVNYVIALFRLPAFIRRAAGAGEVARNASGLQVCAKCSALYDPADYRDDATEIRCASCGAVLPRRTEAST